MALGEKSVTVAVTAGAAIFGVASGGYDLLIDNDPKNAIAKCAIIAGLYAAQRRALIYEKSRKRIADTVNTALKLNGSSRN